MKVIIVGGVAGGASAAARIRRLDDRAEIIMIERSNYISYANCGMPYYIGGIIEEKKVMTLQTPESFNKRFGIDVRVGHEVLSIDSEHQIVEICELETGEIYEESYDKLVLAPGASAIRPNIPGVNGERIYTLRSLEDAYSIRDQIDRINPRRAVVVGGGFIGVEVAENLSKRGIETTIVQRENHLLNTFDYDMASFIQACMRRNGVQLKLNTEVTEFINSGKEVQVVLSTGELLEADIILLAVGVRPENALAKGAGIALGPQGGIIVNTRMETSVNNIYAVGDAVQVKNFVSSKMDYIPLAGPANKQGRVAADNICGVESTYKGTIGSSIIKVYDMTAASTGMTESAAEQAGMKYDKIVLSPSSHAGYYPGSKTMTMKIIYQKTTLRLLGAQIVGFEGVDKRIDVLATAIFAGVTADELKDLDLAYAPPYSSAKDPVNMAGFIVDNLYNERVKQFHWHDIQSLQRGGDVTLLDTRTEKEYARGHVEGFINIPVDELRSRMGEIEITRPVYVMCQSGLRSYIACCMLSQNGYCCYNFSGGYRFYDSVIHEVCASECAMSCGMELR